jgi:T-complex protein 1 subunit alpha
MSLRPCISRELLFTVPIVVLATQAIANVVKSSFGPSGLDKMMVDDIGDVTVTNDGATILGLLDVDHPAGKILVTLAQQQDKEVGQID